MLMLGDLGHAPRKILKNRCLYNSIITGLETVKSRVYKHHYGMENIASEGEQVIISSHSRLIIMKYFTTLGIDSLSEQNSQGG